MKNKKVVPVEPNEVKVDETCTVVDEKNEESSNKSDTEPVIDPGKEEIPANVNDVCSSSTIVIIDDDVKKNEIDVEKVENTEISIPKTPLEQLIHWLHNDAPLTNSELLDLKITMEDFACAIKCVQPSAKREGFATVPDVTWDDIGSLRDIREELQMTILVSNFIRRVSFNRLYYDIIL